MDSRNIATRKRNRIIGLALLAATSSFLGCAYRQAAAGRAATRPGARPFEQAHIESGREATRWPAQPADDGDPAVATAAKEASPEPIAASGQSPAPAPPRQQAPIGPRFAGAGRKRPVIHATEATFEQQVLKSDVPVLVDFYASWCGPCKKLAPTLEQFAAETPQAKVVKVDIDDSPELAARYGVASVPNLIVFKSGRVTARQTGVANKARLKAMVDQTQNNAPSTSIR